jgi:hypothetical protein
VPEKKGERDKYLSEQGCQNQRDAGDEAEMGELGVETNKRGKKCGC